MGTGIVLSIVVAVAVASPASAATKCLAPAEGKNLTSDYRLSVRGQLAGGGDFAVYSNGDCDCSTTWSHDEISGNDVELGDAAQLKEKLKPKTVGVWSCGPKKS